VNVRTRRYFLKTVLLGAAGAGASSCRGDGGRAPAQIAATTATGSPGPLSRSLDGESFDICHAVRDGGTWTAAAPSASHDVVIVGGGPSGMMSAWRLKDRDILLLEKEARFGGNCVLDEWNGIRLSTGGAFYTETEKELVALFAEAGVEGIRVVGGDSLVIDGQPTLDFFRDGANNLPLPQKVRDDFRKSRDVMTRLYATRPARELDTMTFADLLKPYAPELTRFWDRFGPSNWGGDAASTSGYIGCEAYTWAGGADDPRWTFPGGLAGGARQLADKLKPILGERMKASTSVYRVERDGKGAVVRYLEADQPKAVRARAVILAIPKYYTRHIVAGLPKRRQDLMAATRYAPFAVLNVCMDSVGPEPAYDNWFLDAPFTDFIPAEWILSAGKGPRDRKTALTVYYPMAENMRGLLLADDSVLELVDDVAAAIERHFPGTVARIAEVRVFRRGHPMFIPTPNRMAVLDELRAPFGAVQFAHTDAHTLPSFWGALMAADAAVDKVRKLLRA
jgi:predicted NAD/FAD-dependent oxidoreductase